MSSKKRQRDDASAAPKSKKLKKAPEDPQREHRQRSVKSTLLAEEIDFPRGGGTSLTAFEYKTARAEAKSEVADELFKNPETSRTEAPNIGRKTKISKKTKELQTPVSRDKDTFRVEHLNYKRLAVGTKLLCRVTDITPLAVIVSLPNQLMGHIPITQVSSIFTDQLESTRATLGENALDSEDDGGDGEDSGSIQGRGDLPELGDLFTIGQYVRAVVSELRPQGVSGGVSFGRYRDDHDRKAARRVELSIKPDQVNAGVLKGDLVAGFTLSGAVKSVEDHGYVIDLGLGDISGFLSFKHADKGGFGQGRQLPVGCVVSCSVSKVSSNGRTCDLYVDSDTFARSFLTEATSVASVLPGTLVQALITAVLPTGLNVQILGFYEGTIDRFHIPTEDLSSKYKTGQKIKARIIYDIITTSPHRFALSLLHHIIALKEPSIASIQSKTPAQGIRESFPKGTVLDNVKVIRVESEWGLVCEVVEGVLGFVHISNVSDEHVASLSGNAGNWKIGTIHTARVLGFAALDGLLQLTLQKSIIEEKILQITDVQVGQVLRGTVKSLKEACLIVSISGKIDGVVWPLHYSDIRLKHPERKFKEGAKVKARVFAIDPEKQRVSLTLKKTLIDSDLPIALSLGDSSPGMILQGMVSRLLAKGILVDFFGGLRGFVPKRELSEEPVTSIETSFTLGQVVKARVMSVDPEQDNLVISIRQTSSAFKPPVSADAVNIGDVLEGSITAIHKDNVVVALQPTEVVALLSIQNLSNYRGQNIAEVRSSIQVGDLLTNLTVVSKNVEKGLVIVANRLKSKKAKSAAMEKSLNIDNIKIGQVLTGRVIARKPFGTSIKLGPHLFGRLNPTDATDDYSSENGQAFPTLESVVIVAVVHLDKENKHVDLSTRPSRIVPDPTSVDIVDREITALEDLKVGDVLRGYVKNIAKNGLYVTIGRDIDARVLIKEMFDDFVKEWEARFELDQVVKGRITSVDLQHKQVEMSFRSKGTADSLNSKLTLQDFKKGQKVDGRVKSVQEIGLFIEILGTKVSGLCHKSQLSDNKRADVTQALSSFQPEDRVRAVILAIDLGKKRISFGLKPSYFEGDEDVEMDEDKEASSEVTKLGVEKVGDIREEEDDDEDGSEHEDDGESDDEDDDDDDDEGASEDENEAGDDDDDEVMIEMNSTTQPARPAKKQSADVEAPALKIQGGFKWSVQEDDSRMSDASGNSSSDEGDDEPNAASQAAKSKKRKKKTILQDLTTDMHNKAPESSGEFERLLRVSPNSSFLWIQFMSFQLQLSEIDKAREIGRRALQVISFREEQEKMNVWIAMLNLEVMYGTEESLDGMFKEAARANDSKAIHLRLASILDEAGKQEKAEEVLRRATKKFGQSSKVWATFGEYYLKHDRADEARQLLPRSLQSLEARKHVKTIVKFAQLEYHHGASERGRTIFEGVVDSHPKRYDLWSIYVDMEAKQKDISSIRNIFERVLTQKLSTKKAKFFLKKWLELEKKIGDEEGQETVKRKAVEWMQNNTQASQTD